MMCNLNSRAWALGVLLFLSLLVVGRAQAQVSLVMTLEGGDLQMQVDTAIAGQEPTQTIDETRRLSYLASASTQVGTLKIVVSTSCPGQQFDLSIEAVDVSEGRVAGEVVLTEGMLPADFVTNIPLASLFWSAGLRYRAQATLSQGYGIDYHTVEYTVMEQ